MKKLLKFLIIFSLFAPYLCGAEEASEAPRDLRVHEAVRARDLNWLTNLHGICADFNARDEEGQTPLHLAARLGTQPIVDFLVEVDILGQPITELNAQNHNESTPLHIAAKAGRLNVVRALIKAGADINAITGNEETALFFAAQRGLIRMVKLLLRGGAHVDIQSIGSWPLKAAVEGCHLPVVKVLVKAGSPLFRKGDWVCDLHDHNWFPWWNIAKALCAQVGDIDATDYKQRLSIEKNRTCPLVQYLISRGLGGVGVKDSDQETTLHGAALCGYVRIAELLIMNGACVNAVNSAGQTPLHHAAHIDVFEAILLRGHGNEDEVYRRCDPLNRRAASLHEMIALLVAQGADVSAETDDHNTPLLLILTRLDNETSVFRQRLIKAVECLLVFGLPINEDELKLLKKHYPRYHAWLKEKKAALEEILKKTVVAHLPADLQNEIQSFVLTSFPSTKRWAGEDTEDPRPAKKSKNNE